MGSKRAFIPAPEDISLALSSFSLKQRLVWWCMVIVFFIGVGGILYRFNNSLLVEIPARGGAFTEGIVGVPRFINPILAASDADRDLTALVYSGLMRAGDDRELVHDLAERYEISEDGLTYTFTLKPELTWHDGEPITSDDIVFTVQKAQDPALKSPKRASWEGIVAERVDDRTVRFRLKQPYALFLENTTMGIIPKHVWKDLDSELFPLSQLNVEGIGSGPYRVARITRDDSGIPQFYHLAPFENFALGAPYIASVQFRFYPSEEKLVAGFKNGEVDAISAVSPEAMNTLADKKSTITSAALPRIFAVFYNQNQAKVLANKAVRRALDTALNKDTIVREVLHGYGDVSDGPLPSDSRPVATSTTSLIDQVRIGEARGILEKDGWKQNAAGVWEKKSKKETATIAFTVSTADSAELRQAATLIQKTWQELGARVDLKVFEIGDLNQNVIRPRKYDALFFGEIVGRDPDLFSFWHSSQRNDPGLNIALYTSIKADKLLDESRRTSASDERAALNEKISADIRGDVPASFIYSPRFIYLTQPIIKGVSFASIVTNSERFAHINQWFIDTDRVWKLFIK